MSELKGHVGAPTIGAAATDAWVEPPASYPDGDVRQVLAKLPHPPSDSTGTGYALTDLFTVRHALIKAMRPAPRSVFEFGALYGYFLVTALDACPSISRVGWVDDESHTVGSHRKCVENIEAIFHGDYGYGWDRDDAEGQWDLVQVDGDHSFEGCLADLRVAERLGPSWIMLDDWTAPPHTDAVQTATLEWVATTAGRWEITEHETVNGLALLTRRAR